MAAAAVDFLAGQSGHCACLPPESRPPLPHALGPTDQPPVSPSPPASPLPDDEFVVLLTSHQGLLHAFLTSLLPGERCVDDVFQQTNLVLWQKRSEFQAGSNFRAWSLAVARWEVRAWLTRRQRGAWLTFSDELAETMLASFTDTTEGQTADNSTLDSLRQCLGKLKDIDRLLVLSHYQHEKSLAECSRIFKRSSDSLKVTLFRIRQALRRCILAQETLNRARS